MAGSDLPDSGVGISVSRRGMAFLFEIERRNVKFDMRYGLHYLKNKQGKIYA